VTNYFWDEEIIERVQMRKGNRLNFEQKLNSSSSSYIIGVRYAILSCYYFQTLRHTIVVCMDFTSQITVSEREVKAI
jgi:hypothetical protein